MRFQLKASLAPIFASWRDAARFMGMLKRFRSFLAPHARSMSLAALASIGFAATTLLEPWPMQVIFDAVLLGRPVRILGVDMQSAAGGNVLLLLGGASLAVLLLAALRGQLYYAQNVLAATSGIDVVMSIRRQLFHHLQLLSLAYHRRAHSGDLLMRLTGDIVMLREMVVAALITIFSQGLVFIGIITVMAIVNLKLTLVAVLIVPFLYAILATFRMRLVAAADRQRKRSWPASSSCRRTPPSASRMIASRR
jgi:ATP-binding cassette subfamily B protein